MNSIATVTTKGQVTLPAVARRALGIHAGDKLSFTVEADHLIVAPMPDFLSLAGSVTVPPELEGASWADIRERAYQNRDDA